jgi:hypothetical protein
MKFDGLKSAAKIFAMALLGFALAACMRDVKIFSQRNPQWQGQPLKRVMVIGNFQNLIYRHYAEGQMCEYIGDYSDTECFESLKYLFAGQNESAQVAAVLDKQQIDGVIYISTQAHGTTTVDQPTVFETVKWAPGLFSTIGFGGPTSVDWANYSVQLYIPSGALIWQANADASGDPNEMIEHSSYKISRELIDDGVIPDGGGRHYKAHPPQ